MEIRTEDKAKLDIFYHDRSRRAAVIYGRYGIGKTSLLREFSEGKRVLWFSAYPTLGTMELRLMAQSFGFQDLLDPADESTVTLSGILDRVSELAGEQSPEHPLVVIIDSYPDFSKADPSYGKVLHEYFSGPWTELPVKLILTGDSYLSLEKKVLDKKSPWCSEHLMVIGLSPVPFHEAVHIFPEKSPEEAMTLYGMTGGIPAILRLARGKDLPEALSAIFQSSAGAEYLPERRMISELRELSYYNRILTTLASGKMRVNEISDEVGKPKDVVVPYMSTLIKLGFVRKETPVTEKTNRRKTRYRIVNLMDEFWYRFLVPSYGKLLTEDGTSLWNDAVRPGLDSYMKLVFQRIASQYLMERSGFGRLPFRVDEIGNWWENDEESHTTSGFDLVGLGTYSGEPATIFCKVDYSETPVEIQELKSLIELTKRMKFRGSSFYVLFARNGFHENTQTVAGAIRNIVLISLEDMVEELKK